MTCDCQYELGVDDPESACGAGSDCINRLTQIECIEDDCACGPACKNQRMQRKEYANIEIVQTEKKGFGLRAGADIKKDDFIYEYIGEVVSHPSFAKRMRQYADEGIKHFYFMMLQKDEFIDATKKGGIGRFANHSCNPNCYVAKWTVGTRVRMGIYAKRNIRKDEELTFNYNVDRYGHEAQPCYCGEPNCVGFLGGKTQTDVAAMTDVVLEALGISDEVDEFGLKGSKKKRGRKLDEDYVPILKPLSVKEVSKVITAMRESLNRKVVVKLLTRIKMTPVYSFSEHGAQEQPIWHLMRLRGFGLMCNVLEDNIKDVEICTLVLESLTTWPLMKRNKVDASGISRPVTILSQSSEDENVKSLAEKLLSYWESLDARKIIPKKNKESDGGNTLREYTADEDPRPAKRVRKGHLDDLEEANQAFLKHFGRLKPLGRSNKSYAAPSLSSRKDSRASSQSRDDMPKQFTKDSERKKEAEQGKKEVFMSEQEKTRRVAEVIAAAEKAAANAKAKEVKRLAAEKEAAEAEEVRRRKRRAEKAARKRMSVEEKEKLKENRLRKLVGSVVVQYFNKHAPRGDREKFKECAKECTEKITIMEKKSNSFKTGKLEALSEQKVEKIRKFTKEYLRKKFPRSEKSGSSSKTRVDAIASQSRPSNAPYDIQEQEVQMEDVFGIGDDDDADDDVEMGDDEGEDEKSGDPSPASDVNGHDPEPVVTVVGRDVELDEDRSMDIDTEMQKHPNSNNYNRPSSSSKIVKIKRSRWDQRPSSTNFSS